MTQVLCPAVVNDTPCVSAKVSIEPDVRINPDDITVSCNGCAEFGSCSSAPNYPCTFNVRQSLTVQIPIWFGVKASATPDGISCSNPTITGCTAGCVRSHGYYKTHQSVLAELLVLAGGSITLGIPSNPRNTFFYIVTDVAEALTVLNDDLAAAESLPTTLSLANDYKKLYRELLTTRLNYLILDSTSCATAAVNLINTANAFLATIGSYQAGISGANAIQAELEAFNTGETNGCPECE